MNWDLVDRFALLFKQCLPIHRTMVAHHVSKLGILLVSSSFNFPALNLVGAANFESSPILFFNHQNYIFSKLRSMMMKKVSISKKYDNTHTNTGCS